MKKIILSLALTLIPAISFAQGINRIKEPGMLREFHRREILIPEIPGYKTIKGDFHMHTVFSDGDVWPVMRVQEAYYEGLDVIAITDHIEYRPKAEHIGGDHNSSYEIAIPEAERLNMLLVKSGEISRSMPPGHLNALFLEDVNLLETDDYMDAIEEANRQGAFIFWAHPGWDAQQPDTTLWWDVHEELVQKGWLHGVEVYNWDEWYPVAFDWCNEKNLAYFANSDIHIVASHRFNLEKYHRPMTLVFARERSIESIREAMFDRRTVAFFLNNIAGPEYLLRQLFDASVKINNPFSIDEKGTASIVLNNPTDLSFILENPAPGYGAPEKISLQPRSSVIITCNLSGGTAVLPYTVTNFHTGTEINMQVDLHIKTH
jgi:3',5'-nucleoside bisphosphate phosphatase